VHQAQTLQEKQQQPWPHHPFTSETKGKMNMLIPVWSMLSNFLILQTNTVASILMLFLQVASMNPGVVTMMK